LIALSSAPFDTPNVEYGSAMLVPELVYAT
jgi:hypothetical protein